MRTDKKMANGNIIVATQSLTGDLFVRRAGKDQKYKLEQVISFDPTKNTISIDRDVAERYGIKIA